VLLCDEAVTAPTSPGIPAPARRSIRLAVTSREGGGSVPPYAALNLGGHVGDDPAAVAGNRALLAETVGLPQGNVVYMGQVHGARVAVVDGPQDRPASEVDGMVTRTPGLALAVLVADCTPVLLADPLAGVVGVAHAGRAGLVAGVVAAVLSAMAELGARPASTVARVGPAACGACYEVPGQMQREVAARVPQARSTTRRGTPGLDVPAGVAAQLESVCADVRRSPECSIEDPRLYSYRRDRVTGRFAGLAWIEGP
jgi:YfiH family protein